jgi:flagellar basal-body rod protein FlgC
MMMNSLGSSLRVSSSGLAAERTRMDVISANIANANSIKTADQDAYRRRSITLSGDVSGVRVERIVEDDRPLRMVHEPGNPHADADGNVFYSNVEPIEEMVNMISASRAYEANIAAFNSTKGMIKSALMIGKM